MEKICRSQFWDLNQTWHTKDPKFTECFSNTVLTWIPPAFLLLFVSFDIYDIFMKKSREMVYGLSVLTWLKMLATVTVTSLFIADIVLVWNDLERTLVILNLCLILVTYNLSLIIQIIQKRTGIHTSSVQFFFWILCAVCEALSLKTAHSEYAGGTLPRASFSVKAARFGVILFQIILQCFADVSKSQWEHFNVMESDRNKCPVIYSSVLSKMFFSWCTSTAIRGYKRPLEDEDIWEVQPHLRCEPLVKGFLKHWTGARSSDHKKQNRNVFQNIICPCWRTMYSHFLYAEFFKVAGEIMAFTSPQVIGLLISFVEDSNQEEWKGYFYAILILCIALSQSLLMNQFYYCMWQVYMNVQSALNSIVYRKVLKMSSTSRKDASSGEIINLFSVDTDKIRELVYYVDTIWFAPLQIGFALYFLWSELNVAIFAGLAVLILLIPFNWWVTSKLEKIQADQMKKKDLRVKSMNEILSGMKILKLYAWEKPYGEQVSQIRKLEVEFLKKQAYLNSLVEFLWNSCPFLVSLAAFGTYVLIDSKNVLDAKKAFVSLTLFNLLNEPIGMLPTFITKLAQASVSFKRVNNFLNCEEVDPAAVIKTQTKNLPEDSDHVIMKNASFSWENGVSPAVNDISLSIKKGNLIAIVGAVGSGKSSLLSAMLGEMHKISGHVELKGSIAYVPQVAWIQNATLRNNILFNLPCRERIYKQILKDCSLISDLDTLTAGDRTEIGEKGINLSGGQKQRVSLARAAYCDADIYLLDDPLSAVDSHVAEHIFTHLLGPKGYLSQKTRLLVTHSINFLPQMDCILVMKNGEISERGTYQELIRQQGAFSEFLKTVSQQKEKAPTRETTTSENEETLSENFSVSSVVSRKDSDASLHSTRPSHRIRLSSICSTTESIIEETMNENSVDTARLIEKETVSTGTINFRVYFNYVRSIGLFLVAGSLLFYFTSQAFAIGTNMWLSVWSNGAKSNSNNSDVPVKEYSETTYLGVYTGLGFLQSMFFLVGAIFVNIGCLVASRSLHKQMLSRVLKAPMRFFETTPLGRILNRFGEDVELMDSRLPWDFTELINYIFKVIGIFFVISFSTPIFVSAIIPTAILYYLLQRFYVCSTRQISRIQSTLRSPIYSHFSESINGISSIRAYEAQSNFTSELEKRVDTFQGATFCIFAMRRWLSIRLESIGGFLVFLAALFGVLARKTINSSVVGLSVTYSLQITFSLSWLTKVVSYLESDIVSVERVLQYVEETPQEEEDSPKKKNPHSSWPNKGVVEFENYDFRYRPGLELALKGISFKIKGGEKIGIAGRTGAGKSSLTLALLRVVEAAGGSIKIDNIDISEIRLDDLRTRLTIIPQDPVLFSTTVRVNLDPFGLHKDEEIWRALELSHLKNFVRTLPGGLDYEVSEGGDNLSVGQRQLVCLARAILRKTNVLIMDEATAAIDLEADALIQQTIRKEFKHCTVLTIAHRLNTIMDSTRVMVLDKGEIKEFDTPSNLLANKGSIFYGMAKESKIVE